MTLNEAIEKHYKKFKINPYIIGMFWDSRDTEINNIEKAIKDDIPYNEFFLLSKEQQHSFDNSKFVF